MKIISLGAVSRCSSSRNSSEELSESKYRNNTETVRNKMGVKCTKTAMPFLGPRSAVRNPI